MKMIKNISLLAAAAIVAALVNISGISAREDFIREYYGPSRFEAGSFIHDTSAAPHDTSAVADSAASAPDSLRDSLMTGIDTSAVDSTASKIDSSKIYAPPVDSARLMRDRNGIPMRDSIGRFMDTLGRSIDSLGRSLDSLGQPISTRRVLSKAEIRMYRKDSIRAVKDSIIQNTPRILETYVLPDSMWYKRILNWKHDPYFNEPSFYVQDTSYNYHYHDFPFLKEDVDGIYLGVSGSPVMTMNYFKRTKDEDARFFDTYLPYTYTVETLPFYNTKTPYVELQYDGTLLAHREKEEANIKVLATQNITPELNIMMEYHRHGGNGMLLNETTDNRTAVIAANYMGKKYLMHAGYIFNRTKRTENGGMVDTKLVRDTMVDPREIPVWLSEASSETRKNTVFIDQSIRIPFNFLKRKKNADTTSVQDTLATLTDSTAAAGNAADSTVMRTSQSAPATMQAPADTSSAAADSTASDIDVTTAFIGMSNEYSAYRRRYTDNIAMDDELGRQFYNNAFYLDPTTTNDSMRVAVFDNKVYLRLQPWAADAIVSKIDGGVGYKMSQFYLFDEKDYITGPSSTTYNTFYVYAGAQGMFKKYIRWDAFAKYNFAGYANNDLDIRANLGLSFYPFRDGSPILVNARFTQELKEPWFYDQHYNSNHFRWSNSFSKESETKIEGNIEIPKYKLKAFVGYSLLANEIYYDTLGIARQYTESPVSILSAYLEKDFKVWMFHFDNRILFQMSSNNEVLPLPMLSLNLRYYFEFPVKKNVMTMQLGAEGTFSTRWYAPAYNPALGVFQAQNKETIGGENPYINVFLNIQWKRATIFVKLLNVGESKDGSDYFSTYGYIRDPMTVKFGIFWPFYTQPQKDTKATRAKRK